MDRLVILSLLIAALVPLGVASHTPTGRCDSEDTVALGIVEVTGGDASATAYVDDRNLLQGNGAWIYLESNGDWTSQGPGVHQGDVTDHNLQRGGSSPFVPDDNEVCVDDELVLPDTLVL